MKNPEDMTPQEIAQEIADLESQIGTRQVRRSKLRQCQANRACPYAVGDVLVNRQGVRARIDEIQPPSFGGREKAYSISGVYLKKDGTPQVNPGRDNTRPRACSFSFWEGWKPT